MDKNILITGVRLSFPDLFQRSSFEGKAGKYGATFLIKKSDKKNLTLIDKAIKKALEEEKVKVPKGNSCLQDGDDKEYDGYEGCYSLKASNKRRPLIINRDKSEIEEYDDIIYSGCYVNARISFWIQNNKYGKRINSNLWGVQFVADGDRFGSDSVADVDDFEEIDEL